MKINVITNIDNGKGLQRDYYLLREFFQERGHEVIGLQFNSPHHRMLATEADLNIFCETVVDSFAHLSRRNWVFPNPEWWLEEYEKNAAFVDRFLCKTKDGFNLFAYTGKAVYTGFIAEDRRDKTIKRQRKFLHVCGGSRVKNTEAILSAWKQYEIDAPLVVVGLHYSYASNIPNVEWYPYISAQQMIHLQNECLFQLCTSGYEGYGQWLHEAMSTGNILVVTDAPPMNEVRAPKSFRIPVCNKFPLRKGTLNVVAPEAVRDVVLAVLNAPAASFNSAGGKVRKQYEEEQKHFDTAMTDLLANA